MLLLEQILKTAVEIAEHGGWPGLLAFSVVAIVLVLVLAASLHSGLSSAPRVVRVGIAIAVALVFLFIVIRAVNSFSEHSIEPPAETAADS